MRGRLTGLVAVALTAVTLVGAPTADARPAGGVTRHTMPADEASASPARDYELFVPTDLASDEPATALVVFLHGCSQTAPQARLGVGWDALAEVHDVVVAYPEQSTGLDGNGGRCWNSGQALDYTGTVWPRGKGELETIARITRTVSADFDVDPGRVFIAGLSSGALMTSAMTATYPDLYAAQAIVIGCGFPCGDPTGAGAYARMGAYAQVVPTFLAAGSADYLVNPAMSQSAATQWAGTNDLADDGAANGSVSRTPTVEHVDAMEGGEGQLCVRSSNNPCPAGVAGWSQYPYTISRYSDANGVVVESWLIHGLSHNYPGGDFAATGATFVDPHGPDVTTATYEFFAAHAR